MFKLTQHAPRTNLSNRVAIQAPVLEHRHPRIPIVVPYRFGDSGQRRGSVRCFAEERSLVGLMQEERWEEDRCCEAEGE